MLVFRNAMISLIVFFIVLIFSFCGFYYFNIGPTGSNKEIITVNIPSGTSRTEIGNILKEKDLIKNKTAYTLYLKLNKISNLQAGTYDFNNSMDLKTIMNKISNGETSKISSFITFKEGLNIIQMADVITSKTKYTKEEYLNLLANKTYLNDLINKYWFLSNDILNKDIYYPLEGYLFPNTYDLTNLSLKQIVEKQLDETKLILDKYKNDLKASKYSIHEILTLASMVELEGNSDESRPKLADVFYNRLNIGMSLGSDVTAHYGVQKSLTSEITKAELKAINPYNTRNVNFSGLPVGPICNPGESSIKATIYPTEVHYTYFMADKNGKIYFSTTYAEQNEKIAGLKSKGLWFTYE